MDDKLAAIFKSDAYIWGRHPLTNLPVCFIPFEPNPGRAKVLVIIDDDFFYTPDAGLTWEANPNSIDVRQVDIVLSKPEGFKDETTTYRRFLPEQEYVDSFKRQGKTVPPFLVMQPYVERNGVKGYMVPCNPDAPDAELYPSPELWKKHDAHI